MADRGFGCFTATTTLLVCSGKASATFYLTILGPLTLYSLYFSLCSLYLSFQFFLEK